MPTESCTCWNSNPSYLSHQNAVLVGIYTPSCSGTTTLNSDTYNKSLKATLNSRISHKYNNKRTTPLIATFLDRQKTVRLSTTLSLSLSLCLAFLTLRLFFCYIFFLFWVLVFQSISAMKILFSKFGFLSAKSCSFVT